MVVCDLKTCPIGLVLYTVLKGRERRGEVGLWAIILNHTVLEIQNFIFYKDLSMYL